MKVSLIFDSGRKIIPTIEIIPVPDYSKHVVHSAQKNPLYRQARRWMLAVAFAMQMALDFRSPAIKTVKLNLVNFLGRLRYCERSMPTTGKFWIFSFAAAPSSIQVGEFLSTFEPIFSAFHLNCAFVWSGFDVGVILTAAHCVDKKDPSSLKIRAGEWDTQTNGNNAIIFTCAKLNAHHFLTNCIRWDFSTPGASGARFYHPSGLSARQSIQWYCTVDPQSTGEYCWKCEYGVLATVRFCLWPSTLLCNRFACWMNFFRKSILSIFDTQISALSHVWTGWGKDKFGGNGRYQVNSNQWKFWVFCIRWTR